MFHSAINFPTPIHLIEWHKFWEITAKTLNSFECRLPLRCPTVNRQNSNFPTFSQISVSQKKLATSAAKLILLAHARRKSISILSQRRSSGQSRKQKKAPRDLYTVARGFNPVKIYRFVIIFPAKLRSSVAVVLFFHLRCNLWSARRQMPTKFENPFLPSTVVVWPGKKHRKLEAKKRGEKKSRICSTDYGCEPRSAPRAFSINLSKHHSDCWGRKSACRTNHQSDPLWGWAWKSGKTPQNESTTSGWSLAFSLGRPTFQGRAFADDQNHLVVPCRLLPSAWSKSAPVRYD